MRDYVLTMIVIGIVPVAFVRPWIGVLAWYWIGLMSPHRLTWDFAYAMPFAQIIAVATLAGAVFARDRKRVPAAPEIWLALTLLAYFLLTTPLAWAPAEAWSQLQKVSKIILMTIVTTIFIYSRHRITLLFYVIALSIGFYGFKGGLWVIGTGGGEQVLGPEGSFIEGNTFIGLALNMVIPVIVALALEEERPWLRRALFLVAALSAIASVFTYSRGAWLGLAVVAPLVLFQLRRRGAQVLLVVGLIGLVIASPFLLPERMFNRADTLVNYEEDCSANQRFMSWVVHWNIAKDNPLTGGGFQLEEATDGRYLTYGSDEYLACFRDRESSAAHNIYFQILGQHGFVAFFIYIALLVVVQVNLMRIRRRAYRDPATRWIGTYATGLQIGLAGYLVSGAFLSSAYFDLPWLYFALTAILARELKAAPGATEARGVQVFPLASRQRGTL